MMCVVALTIALGAAASGDGDDAGWFGLKFKGIRSMPSVVLRHDSGLPELLLVHEP